MSPTFAQQNCTGQVVLRNAVEAAWRLDSGFRETIAKPRHSVINPVIPAKAGASADGTSIQRYCGQRGHYAPPSSFCHVVAVVTLRGTFPRAAGETRIVWGLPSRFCNGLAFAGMTKG